MSDLVQYGNNDVYRPTGAIWADCPASIIQSDPLVGCYIFADHVTPANTADTRYEGFSILETNNSVAQVASTATLKGAVTWGSASTANDYHTMLTNAVYRLYKNSGKKMWCEIRFAPANVTDAQHSMCFGLTSNDGLVGDVIDDGGADLISYSFIGWRVFDDDGDDCEFIHQATGAETNVAAADKALVAATYTKLGMRFDGKQTLFVYVDGEKVASINVDDLTHTKTDYLGLIYSMKSATTEALSATVDFLGFACEW